jgi:hypothetical protein
MSRIRYAGGARGLATGAAVLALAACGQKTAGSSAPSLTPAQACLRTTDPAQGIDLCKAAIAQNQEDPALRRRMGLLRLKSHSLAAARQSYQVAMSLTKGYDADADFGLGLVLQSVGEAGAGKHKIAAAAADPAVVDRFRKAGIDEPDLMLFDTEPVVVGGQSPTADKAMEPKEPLAQGLTVDVRCLVSLTSTPHDCVVVSPLKPGQEAYGEAAKAILAREKVTPAKKEGAPVADAPVYLSYVFWPKS